MSIAILIISGLVVSAFGPNLIRAVNGLRRQHDEVARRSERSPRPPADAPPWSSMPSSADRSANAPVTREGENGQILELKSKLWEAIFNSCRIDLPDPVQAWREHTDNLIK